VCLVQNKWDSTDKQLLFQDVNQYRNNGCKVLLPYFLGGFGFLLQKIGKWFSNNKKQDGVSPFVDRKKAIN
jgi:hypothetical protein